MSSQLSTQEKFNRLNLNLKVKKIDANTLRALIVTNNNFFEASDYLSTCIQEIAEVMPELVILNDMNKEYIDYDKIIEWSIKKSTSDNQIYEFFQELEEQFGEFIEYTYYWEKTNYFEAKLSSSGPEYWGALHPGDITDYIEQAFTRFGSDNPIKDEWRQVHFSEISQISDQLVILHKYGNDKDNLFDYNGRFLNEELIYCIEAVTELFPEELMYCTEDDISFYLGDNNLVLLTAIGEGDFISYLVEWTGDGFKFIEKLEEDSDIPKKYYHNDYTKVEELTKLFSTILKTKE